MKKKTASKKIAFRVIAIILAALFVITGLVAALPMMF